MNTDNYLGHYYTKDNKIYKCISIIEHPAVVLENIETKKQETHITGCLNYKEFKKLIEEK